MPGVVVVKSVPEQSFDDAVATAECNGPGDIAKTFSGPQCGSKLALTTAVAEALGFPTVARANEEHVLGINNWDSFADCLYGAVCECEGQNVLLHFSHARALDNARVVFEDVCRTLPIADADITFTVVFSEGEAAS